MGTTPLAKSAATRIRRRVLRVAVAGGVMVRFPNEETRRLAHGPSSIISKAVIEEFSKRFLGKPGVIFLSESGNKVLKRTLFLSAFAALSDPVSRTYYDRKIAQGKRHNQALIALARRRCDVLYAMLRDGTLYETQHQLAA